ncbi:MAG: ribbon-helix-helix domain-containing protein [Dermatophilaceae bacterium]
MTVQITVRLPDELVAFVDAEVGEGRVRSRADAVARALHREQRRRRAEADAAIYAEGTDAEVDAIVAHTSSRPVDLSEHDR